MLNIKGILLSASILMSISTNCTAENTRSQTINEFMKTHENALRFAAFFCVGAIVNAAKNSFDEGSASNKVLNFTENLAAGVLFVNSLSGEFVKAGSRMPSNPERVAIKSGYTTDGLPLFAFIFGAMVAPSFK